MVGHCAVRHYAMGERSLDERPATDDDIAAMCTLVDEAIGAGALGFSTSRTLLHRVPDGRPVPGTWADERELLAIADVLGRRGRGVYEVATAFRATRRALRGHARRGALDGRDQSAYGPTRHVRPRAEQRRPGAVSQILELVDEEGEHGGELRPQTTARGIGCSSVCNTARSSIASRYGPRCRRCRSTSVWPRCTTTSAVPSSCRAADDGKHTPLDWRGVYVLTPDHVDYSADPETSLGADAQRHGETIPEAFVRISLETEGRALFNYPFLNQRMDAVEELLDHRGWRSASATPARTWA